MLSTQGGEIDQAVEAERLQIGMLFLVLAGVMVVLSMLLARTIADPVRRLADAAERDVERVIRQGDCPAAASAEHADRREADRPAEPLLHAGILGSIEYLRLAAPPVHHLSGQLHRVAAHQILGISPNYVRGIGIAAV